MNSFSFQLSPGSGSRKGTNLGAAPDEATRLDLPACLSVAPLILLTSLTFSLTRVLRVPTSGKETASSTWTARPSEPSGSTNTCGRAFGRGWIGREELEGSPPEIDPVFDLWDGFEVANAGRLETAGAGVSSGGAARDVINRFWNSVCLVLRRSTGSACLLIPRRNTSSASLVLHVARSSDCQSRSQGKCGY